MKAKIGIKEESQSEIAHELAKLLADEFVLYTKTRNAHWNVEGPDFYNKHKFFEDQFNAIDEILDEVAERLGPLRRGGKYPVHGDHDEQAEQRGKIG